MNPSTVFGILSGIGIVTLTVVFSVEQSMLLWNPMSLLIVLGGTLAAASIAFPLSELKRIMFVFLIVLRNEKTYAEKDFQELVQVSRTLSSGKVHEIEGRLGEIKNPFLRLGIQLVIDSTPAEDVIEIMSWRISKLRSKERNEAKVFYAMASFAPAFGMIGTLLGLVNMLTELGNDIGALGLNMAVALMTTLYGIIAGNLIFKPIGMKFEHRTEQRVALMHTIMQGISLLCLKRAPGVIEETLQVFASDRQDEIFDPNPQDRSDPEDGRKPKRKGKGRRQVSPAPARARA